MVSFFLCQIHEYTLGLAERKYKYRVLAIFVIVSFYIYGNRYDIYKDCHSDFHSRLTNKLL